MDETKLEAALIHADVKMLGFLGEGAWHYAWKVQKDHIELVLRIPKDVAYGKPVPFEEEALNAEYAGTELYYQSVNKAVDGAAPMLFEFHVSSELTYTLESYGGKQIDLHAMTKEAAFQTGKEIGEIHRKTEEVQHGLNGFGYLAWTQEKGLQGTISGDASEFLKEESEEHIADYQALCAARPEYEDNRVSEAIQLAVALRKKPFTKPFLVNQDASPENILLNGNRVYLIDPYPSIYYPRAMAGNFMNLYETFFITLAGTERYQKHQFKECEENLKLIAKGFIEGYSAGNPQIASEVRGEQLLQLLETAYSHYQLLSEDLAEETRIRYGSKEEIENRLPQFSEELKVLAASQIDELKCFLAYY
ncbi:hypothetical protein [Planococcus shenhongbingii]|uniref:Aminoglycoside phosphotransferase domain-containing protein n=1 Tax=Planococcus shenhongbingii TaxID=3058398 RepID=A0ABT8N8P0_9BACL|nr:hypothetical protein [Planococcus sp. N017]MDN7243905.1 hypothetical protein [Planococcus sp. N017]